MYFNLIIPLEGFHPNDILPSTEEMYSCLKMFIAELSLMVNSLETIKKSSYR